MKFEVSVKFYVEADSMEDVHPTWTAQAAAIDFVSHRIDEGYPMSDHIFCWTFLDVKQVEQFSDGVEEEWKEHQKFLQE
jgi:hypothetical protein